MPFFRERKQNAGHSLGGFRASSLPYLSKLCSVSSLTSGSLLCLRETWIHPPYPRVGLISIKLSLLPLYFILVPILKQVKSIKSQHSPQPQGLVQESMGEMIWPMTCKKTVAKCFLGKKCLHPKNMTRRNAHFFFRPVVWQCESQAASDVS